MQKLHILNSREIKKIRQLMEIQFGTTLKGKYAYLRNENNRIFLVNEDISRITLENLHIDRLGLYFAEQKENTLRLSKEGALLLVREAAGTVQNMEELDEKETRQYFKGEDVKKELGGDARFIILHHQKRVLGCAKYKEGIILNFLPKIHRGEVIL